jgi:hypothetical protein
MTTIAVELTQTEKEQLRKLAEGLNLPPEDLVGAIVRDFIGPQAADFDAASRRVLEKNRELYRRLA